MLDQLDRDGFAIVPDLLGPEAITQVTEAFDTARFDRSQRRGQTFGARNILGLPAVREIAEGLETRSLVGRILGANFRVVRGLFFDKTEGANWPVPWHQDLTVALAAQRDTDGWDHWSVKAGTVHAQPPVALLDRMLTLRIHLDACGKSNGPLRVLPGTHRLGRLSRERIVALTKSSVETVCVAARGSVLLMRPLLLHASSPATRPAHRRVLHLEFAAEGLLPEGLAWAA